MSEQDNADDSRTVEQDTFEQILEQYKANGFETVVDDLNTETDDFEDLQERDSEVFSDEYMDVDLVEDLKGIDGFDCILTLKSGAEPDWNEAETRAILKVYHVGDDLYFVNNDLYHDEFNYFCPQSFLTGALIDGVEDNHFSFVEFVGDVENGVSANAHTELAEEIVSELENRWTQRLD
jgi:hypothetical protein